MEFDEKTMVDLDRVWITKDRIVCTSVIVFSSVTAFTSLFSSLFNF